MKQPRPERIAAAARALGAELIERLALHADGIATALARELGMVAWDREQLLGQVQRQQWRLREQRFRRHGGPPVRVLERRRQPLECIEPAWRGVRQGRRVRVEHEPGACSAGLEILRGMGRALGYGVLGVAEQPWRGEDDDSWVGVAPARSRLLMADADADPELTAYVLARACLRRGGADPRGVRQAWCVDSTARLQRHLQRLWLGARVGPPEHSGSFAGPVDADVVEAYLAALAAWEGHQAVSVLCAGGLLERADDPAHYLAPALLAVSEAVPDLPVAGPMLVLVRAHRAQAVEAFQAAGPSGRGRVYVGSRPADVQDGHPVRAIQGALLAERLPPGLPEPRPV